jgi:hypothetical protein
MTIRMLKLGHQRMIIDKRIQATRREEYDREASQPANQPILAADIPMIKLASS